jgi:hypothetical protein
MAVVIYCLCDTLTPGHSKHSTAAQHPCMLVDCDTHQLCKMFRLRLQSMRTQAQRQPCPWGQQLQHVAHLRYPSSSRSAAYSSSSGYTQSRDQQPDGQVGGVLRLQLDFVVFRPEASAAQPPHDQQAL